jgi:acyl carrier protein
MRNMTTQNEITGAVTEALAAEGETDRSPGDLTSEVTLDGDGLALTSLGFVRAMVELEDRLGVELEDAVVMSSEFGTVGDIVRFVEEAVEKDRGGG